MRYLLCLFFCSFISIQSAAQEYFSIQNYDIDLTVNQDASVGVVEKLTVHFTEPRHGIFRKIPYRYRLESLRDSAGKADVAWESNGYRYTKIKNIKVKNFHFTNYTDGDYQTIKIGSKDQFVDGIQTYQISYTILGAINFFSDFSELYLNLSGNEWPVEITRVHFRIHLYKPLPAPPRWFVATGSSGSVDNLTDARWSDSSVLSGQTLQPLPPYNGVTAGIRMPLDFLNKPDYTMIGKGWLALPVAVFIGMFLIWRRWGKDLPVTVTTEFYPPQGVSPSVAGYVIDGKLNRRDLTALIPYWGAGGYLRIEEIETKKLLGLIKGHDYKFIRLKELPATRKDFEQTFFSGLFSGGDEVLLSSLKDTFYTTMDATRRGIQNEIKAEHYYVRFTRTFSGVLPVVGLVFFVFSLANGFFSYPLDILLWTSLVASSTIVIVFGALMEKKTQKGTELYEQLLGFKEFIKTVEKDRLQEFLSQDENYFDKILPFAIVFNVADTWKDKLKGLDVPPPSWYSGYYSGDGFSTAVFINSLDQGLSSMSQSFYSRPAASSSSGGSFGGGGFSGGGFGGGGGGSW